MRGPVTASSSWPPTLISVLLDFPANPPGELTTANDTAVQQCQIFNRRTAVLESLNVRDEGVDPGDLSVQERHRDSVGGPGCPRR